MDIEFLLNMIRMGIMPPLTGIHLTKDQIDLIKAEVEKHKKKCDDYISICVEPRLIK